MRLSVVVTIVEGGGVLEESLRALAAQQDPPDMEVIVPWDDSVVAIHSLESRFPQFRFLAIGAIATARAAGTAAGQHELFDRRRAAGLAAAGGDVVAIIEDRGVPRPNWASALVRAHASRPNLVVGGAIENGRDALLNWAVYFCDFSRYQLPFAPGPREWVSDVNIGYKRQALDRTRELWRDRYHETTVHWALQRAGESLFLTPEFVVDQMRGRLRLGGLMVERLAWGRLFAYTRAREISGWRRVALAAAAPFLPFLLFARHARTQVAKRVALGKFIRASPIVLLLLAAWSLGEIAGYVTGDD
jgi:hypothetical protein